MDHYLLLLDSCILYEERVGAALRRGQWVREIRARSDRQERRWGRVLRWLAAFTTRQNRRELEETTAV